jgi:hypothetical protein
MKTVMDISSGKIVDHIVIMLKGDCGSVGWFLYVAREIVEFVYRYRVINPCLECAF